MHGIKMMTWDLQKHHDICIVPLADLHIGCEEFREDVLSEHIRFIEETPEAYAVLLGDLVEAGIRASKSDIWKQRLNPQQQVEECIRLLMPIKDKILGLVMGNHEWRIYDSTGIDVCSILWQNLELPMGAYGRDGLMLRVYLTRHRTLVNPFYIYLTHGWGGARKTGGQINKAEELGIAIHADLYLVAHEHTVFTSRHDYRMPHSRAKGGLTMVEKVFVGCGCFVDYTGIGGYLVRIGRRPPNLGAPKIWLSLPSGHGKKIRVVT